MVQLSAENRISAVQFSDIYSVSTQRLVWIFFKINSIEWAANKPGLLIESLNLELDSSVKVDIGVEGGVMDMALIEPWKEAPSEWAMSSPDMGSGVICQPRPKL